MDSQASSRYLLILFPHGGQSIYVDGLKAHLRRIVAVRLQIFAELGRCMSGSNHKTNLCRHLPGDPLQAYRHGSGA